MKNLDNNDSFIQPQSVDEKSLINIVETAKIRHTATVSKKSRVGGFLNMGFSKPILNGVLRMGYKLPTPIQKAGIPVIQSGQDIVAMARTGSGKTACFLLPMFEILKTHAVNTGTRALILSPTRELAEQTLRFATKLGKFTGLHCMLVVGGDSMDQQFEAMHQDPDIIIATPGRLVHLCAEMGRRLEKVQYVVFDEADRLFEMGFREQLGDILDRLAPTRQTLLFSATLPQMLVDFAKAGLNNPVMVRLDKDDKLSEHLQLAFFSVAPNFKLHLLLYTLRCVVKRSEQVLVFAATQLHVQYLETILNMVHLPCTYLYSDMDPTSRRISAAKFQKRMVNILVATDIAARGIDIPSLDYVINYNFPFNAKVFIHRVGRVARAGKKGIAINFVSSDEEAYLWDLHKFLGRAVVFSPKLETGAMSETIKLDMEPNSLLKMTAGCNDEDLPTSNDKYNWNFQFGCVPDIIFSEEADQISRLFADPDIILIDQRKDNANKLYERTRPRPTKEALKEMRDTRRLCTPGLHPLLLQSVRKHITHSDAAQEMLEKKMIIIQQLKNVKLKKNIFEIGSKGVKNTCRNMQLKRKKDDEYIAQYQEKLELKRAKYEQLREFKLKPSTLPMVTDEDLLYDFPDTHQVKDLMQKTVDGKLKDIKWREEEDQIIKENEAKTQAKLEAKLNEKKKRQSEVTDNVKSGNFIPYRPSDVHTERGYNIHDNFSSASHNARLELLQDNRVGLDKVRSLKRKEASLQSGKRKESDKKIKTESGRLIRASYKTQRYEAWCKRKHIDPNQPMEGASENPEQRMEVMRQHAIEDSIVSNTVISTKKNTKNAFQVLSTKSAWKKHPLVKANEDKLKLKGTKVIEEVRNKQQIKKHRRLQKKYAEDMERGQAIKKMKEKSSGNPKSNKKRGLKDRNRNRRNN